ncbi:hypothetical protein D9615_005475 [Tricholomella constricta]|uniref:Uncharacterized protein n=1 Tax=Tricholomella constricta TaxID=117010 RepID=A0A8H5M5I5_9AGAR|nr:hypothetical protein D9615_005475 [Tricholomella constricta]
MAIREVQDGRTRWFKKLTAARTAGDEERLEFRGFGAWDFGFFFAGKEHEGEFAALSVEYNARQFFLAAMDDGDHEGPNTALHSDPRFIVATTLATLVIAGSAFIWRSNPRNIVGISHHQLGESAHEDPDSVVTSDNERPGSETSKPASSSSKGSTAGTAIIIRDELGEESEAKETKASRPKERRRRGKDPLKDILKNVKKSKLLAKPSRTGDSEDGGTGQLPKINEVTRHSRGASQATSSRSISSASNRRSSLPTQDRASPYPSSNQGSHTGDGDDEDEDEDEEDTPPAASSSTPRPSTSLETQPFSSSLPAPDPDTYTSSSVLVSNPSHTSQTGVSPNIPLSSSSSVSQSTSIFSSDCAITPNTSPTLSLSGKTPTLAPVEVPPYAQSKSLVASASSPAVRPPPQKAVGPWDWDGVGPTVKPDSMYRKPPRFRSKSRGSGSIPMSPTIPASASLDTYSSDLPSSSSCVSSSTASAISSGSIGSHEDISLSFTFPSLNASANPSSCSQASPGPSHVGITSHFNGNGNASVNNNLPRRAPTPRRPPTPLSGTSTPPPSLSSQTQLASLRGALEAARLREEKTKGDIERYSKELEIMRWESTALRRREVELQTQVHHLVHQVQTYAAVFASMGPPSQHPQHHMPPSTNPNTNGPTNSAPSGYQFSPSSSNPHSPPPHLQIPSAQILLGNGVLSPSSMLSPMSMAHTSPHSPFYPYASHSPHHMHVQQQQQQAQSPHQPSNNLFSVLFRHPLNVSGAQASGPSSVAGSSSVGSHSPDLSVPSLSTSPPQPVSVDDAGRRRTRTRTQTAGPRIGGSGGVAWDGDESDGWVVGDNDIPADDDGGGSYSDHDDEEGSVSEVLADAILKRPGSIRGLSKKGKFKEKEREKEVQHTEFTFPSLSDFGNVSRAYPVPIEAPIEEKDLARAGNDEAANNHHINTNEVMQAPQPATTNNELEVTSFDVQ